MINYLVAAPDLAAAKTQLASEGVDRNGVWEWAQDHVFPVRAWTSTSPATQTLPDGTYSALQVAPRILGHAWLGKP
jgi:hypothetical protein